MIRIPIIFVWGCVHVCLCRNGYSESRGSSNMAGISHWYSLHSTLCLESLNSNLSDKKKKESEILL